MIDSRQLETTEDIVDNEKMKVALFMFALSSLVAFAIYAVNACGALP